MLRIRESFGAKLLTGLLATVGVLLIVVYAVVRSVTDAQVAEVSDEAVRSALVQFEAREELRVWSGRSSKVEELPRGSTRRS